MKLALTASLGALMCFPVAVIAGSDNPAPPVGAPISSKMAVLPGPIPIRLAHADVVVTGKVTKIEDKMVPAAPFPGATDKVDYQIAVVKVADPIANAKGLKEIRVGFVPATPGVIRPGGYRPPTLTEDEEALLFLTKHPEGDFYTYAANGDLVKKANYANFEKDVEEAKKAAKLLDDAMANLKAKSAADRFETAAMLIERYRTRKAPFDNAPKEEPIDAAESKLILEALRDADWTPPGQPAPVGSPHWQLTPMTMFNRLGLSKEDKWEPKPGGNVADTAKEWLKDNAGTYRIKRYVPEKKDKDPEKKKE